MCPHLFFVHRLPASSGDRTTPTSFAGELKLRGILTRAFLDPLRFFLPRRPLSASLVHDMSVRVWDVTRPWLPIFTFEEHKEVVTGIFWAKNRLFSCSKVCA